MLINELLKKQNMTKYRLAKQAGIAHATLNDLCSGKTRIEKCSAGTLYKIAKTLRVPMEALLEGRFPEVIEGGLQEGGSVAEAVKGEPRAAFVDCGSEREQSYEYGLPGYLQHDLDAYKEGLDHGSTLMDCLWGELYGSINAAEITDGAITPEHADYLRQKFLWRQADDDED